MKYFEYAIEIDSKGLRVLDPDTPDYFNPEYMFKQHAWLPGSVFSFEEHPEGGLYLKRIVPDEEESFTHGWTSEELKGL